MIFTMELKERWLKPRRSVESMIVLKVEVKPICTLLLYFSNNILVPIIFLAALGNQMARG